MYENSLKFYFHCFWFFIFIFSWCGKQGHQLKMKRKEEVLTVWESSVGCKNAHLGEYIRGELENVDFLGCTMNLLELVAMNLKWDQSARLCVSPPCSAAQPLAWGNRKLHLTKVQVSSKKQERSKGIEVSRTAIIIMNLKSKLHNKSSEHIIYEILFMELSQRHLIIYSLINKNLSNNCYLPDIVLRRANADSDLPQMNTAVQFIKH